MRYPPELFSDVCGWCKEGDEPTFSTPLDKFVHTIPVPKQNYGSTQDCGANKLPLEELQKRLVSLL